MREDIDLQREILEELRFEPSLDAASIGVTVRDGIVTLSGTVGSYAEKLAAEKAAQRVRGVRAVAEEIEVRLPTMMERTDTDVAWAALNSLAWNTLVPNDRIRVKVEDGWVTLEGEVEWSFERDAAQKAVRYLTGVRGVTNLITIKPRVQTQEVKDRIAEAFKRNAELDAARIRVEAVGGTVTLSGHVHSWVERDEADRVAWAVPGVSKVENHLDVSP